MKNTKISQSFFLQQICRLVSGLLSCEKTFLPAVCLGGGNPGELVTVPPPADGMTVVAEDAHQAGAAESRVQRAQLVHDVLERWRSGGD